MRQVPSNNSKIRYNNCNTEHRCCVGINTDITPGPAQHSTQSCFERERERDNIFLLGSASGHRQKFLNLNSISFVKVNFIVYGYVFKPPIMNFKSIINCKRGCRFPKTFFVSTGFESTQQSFFVVNLQWIVALLGRNFEDIFHISLIRLFLIFVYVDYVLLNV